MLNKEVVIVEEFFVKAHHHDNQGRICPLPLEGRFVFAEFRNSWLRVKLPKGQTPRVSAGPTILADGPEGYSIRKEIVPQELVPTFPSSNIQ